MLEIDFSIESIMEHSNELNILYIKAVKVIDSCLTLVQLDVAIKYVERYEKVYANHFYDIEDYNPIRLIGMIELKKIQLIDIK